MIVDRITVFIMKTWALVDQQQYLSYTQNGIFDFCYHIFYEMKKDMIVQAITSSSFLQPIGSLVPLDGLLWRFTNGDSTSSP